MREDNIVRAYEKLTDTLFLLKEILSEEMTDVKNEIVMDARLQIHNAIERLENAVSILKSSIGK